MTTDNKAAEIAAENPYLCLGCGKPAIGAEGKTKPCGCATMVGRKALGNSNSIVFEMPCAWCKGTPIRETLDGEPLCQECCVKWAKAEGEAVRNHLTNEARDD